MFDLGGCTALVTGAGQGVGAGIARALAQQGARVAVNDLHAERAQRTAGALEAQGAAACAVPFDVVDAEAVRAGIAQAEATLGPLDILVNNAGVPAGMQVQPFRETTPAQWRPYIDINLYGVMNCSHAALQGMAERGYGRIITIASGAGTVGLALGVAAYGAGKGGAIAFMRHLAIENAAAGITANSIALGLIDNQADPAVTARLARTVPAGRLGRPEDAGALCVYLASREASWMTGQTLQLDGGAVTR